MYLREIFHVVMPKKVHELTTPIPDHNFYYKIVFAKAYYGSQLELTATQLSTQHLPFYST